MPASQCSPLMIAYRPMQWQRGRWRRRQVGSSLSQRLREMQYACCSRGDMIKCCAWHNYSDMHLQPQPNLCAVQIQHAISCARLLRSSS